jgi:hypothetical protein
VAGEGSGSPRSGDSTGESQSSRGIGEKVQPAPVVIPITGSAGCIHIEDHTVGVVLIRPATDDSNPCRTCGDGPCLANGRHHVGRQQLGVDLVLLFLLPGAVDRRPVDVT